MKTFFSCLVASVFVFGIGVKQLKAEFTNQDLANSGLILNWESNIGGSPLANGAESLKFWAHTTQKNEVVRFYANGKLVKTFRADDVDDQQLENALLSGKSLKEAPRLGLAGATQKAEKLSTLYKKIGRQTDIQTEISKAYYAIAASDTGILSALDAESGVAIWKRQLPYPELPILGPAVSDDYVAILNGQELIVYQLQDGTLAGRRKMTHVATGKPVLYEGKLAVPSTGGRLIIYDILNPNIAEQMLRVGTENRIGIVKSTDSEFLCWPMQNKLLVAKLENPPMMWYNFDAGNGSELPSTPIPVPGGFLVASLSGTVSKFSTDRNNPFQWKSSIGTTCNQAPVVGTKNVAVIAQDGRLFLMDLATGNSKWNSPLRGIESILTVTEKHIYALDTAKNLVTIDAETSQIKSRMFIGNRTAVSNSSTDRVVLADQHGSITCLREPDSPLPILVAPFTPRLSAEAKAAQEQAAADSESSTTTDEDAESEFDSDEFGEVDSDTSESTEEEDPFGAF